MNRRLLAIAAAACVVLLLAWNFLLYSPRKDQIQEAQDREAAAAAQKSQLETQRNRLRAAQRNEPRLRAQLETLKVAIPDTPNLAQYILDLNDVALRSGIVFLSVTHPPPAAGGEGLPNVIATSINVTGGYFQVLDFINRLVAMPRLITIDTLGLSPEAGGLQLSVSIGGRTFTRAAPGVPAATTTTVAPAATTTTVAGGTPVPTAPATVPA